MPTCNPQHLRVQVVSMYVAVYLTLHTTFTIFNGTTTTGGVLITTWFIFWSYVSTTIRVVRKHLCVRCKILVFTYMYTIMCGSRTMMSNVNALCLLLVHCTEVVALVHTL